MCGRRLHTENSRTSGQSARQTVVSPDAAPGLRRRTRDGSRIQSVGANDIEAFSFYDLRAKLRMTLRTTAARRPPANFWGMTVSRPRSDIAFDEARLVQPTKYDLAER
jgi:hypothetical protein